MKKGKKKSNFLKKFLIYLAFFAILLFATIKGTKYYFYDSDLTVKQTDLSGLTIDGIKLKDIAADVDTSSYNYTDYTEPGCNYNFKELSYRSNAEDQIEYIVADYKKVNVKFNEEQAEKLSRISDVWKALGSNYTKDTYKPEENNYWRICRYTDSKHGIYIGIVYSRYNNDIAKIIVSTRKIK